LNLMRYMDLVDELNEIHKWNHSYNK
jgi:hypothetical protein